MILLPGLSYGGEGDLLFSGINEIDKHPCGRQRVFF